MIIVYKEFKNNKAEFTKEELEELLEKAKKEGYDEGYSKGYSDGKCVQPIPFPTSPTAPISPTFPITWATCETNSSIQGESGIIEAFANKLREKYKGTTGTIGDTDCPERWLSDIVLDYYNKLQKGEE